MSVGLSVCNAFVRRSTRRTLLAYLALFLARRRHSDSQGILTLSDPQPLAWPQGLLDPFVLVEFPLEPQGEGDQGTNHLNQRSDKPMHDFHCHPQEAARKFFLFMLTKGYHPSEMHLKHHIFDESGES